MKTSHHTARQFDLFPASLLVKRRRWQRIMHELPVNGCLLILQKENTAQVALMERLGHAFHDQGRRVFVLKVE